ncbi:hypothetical protein [Mycolicibacterium sp.]|uniref:hypothetical protein n=1 Tax=Mycolicibacterium sp. TaxID=2320850 RepID=UPI0037C7102A
MATVESFTVSYDALGVTRDGPDPDLEPDLRPMTANVDFIYRVPPGHVFRAASFDPRPTDLGFAGFECRVDEGRLKHLNGNVNFTLPANTPMLGWPDDLYIDVRFRNVVYARARRRWPNFAFICPTTPGVTVNLTTVERHPYLPEERYANWFNRPAPSGGGQPVPHLPKGLAVIESAVEPAINTDAVDFVDITNLDVDIESMTVGLTGSPRRGQRLTIAIRSAAAHAINWGPAFGPSGAAALPAESAAGLTITAQFIYDTRPDQWICWAVDAAGY